MHGIEHRVCEECITLAKGCYVVGGFERKYEFEKPPARFVRQTPEGMVQDDFPDEVCLVLEHTKGLVVIVGCGHPGILNMLETIKLTVWQTDLCGIWRIPSGGGGRGKTCADHNGSSGYGDFPCGIQPLYRRYGAGASFTVRRRCDIFPAECGRLYLFAISIFKGKRRRRSFSHKF